MTGRKMPQVLRYEAALQSSDLRVRTVAKILNLACALVRVDVAVFYVVGDRLEKYATDPIIAKINQPLPVGIEEALREYREHWGEHDPFAPSRAARRNVTVLTSQEVGGEVFRGSRRPAAAWFFPVAEMYLRAGAGKIVAGIAFFRDPAAPELGVSETWMLRDLHELCEHTYRLATGSALY